MLPLSSISSSFIPTLVCSIPHYLSHSLLHPNPLSIFLFLSFIPILPHELVLSFFILLLPLLPSSLNFFLSFLTSGTFCPGCVAEALPVREERGACFRLVGPGAQCLHPVSTQLSKQLCCCSVGKAWGPHCDRCPLPGTAAFKEICPGGMGYHVTTPYVYKPKPPPSNPRNHPDNHGQTKPTIRHQEPVPGVLPLPFPTLQQPVEAFSFTERQLPIVPVEKTSPAAPVAILPSSASQDISPTQLAEVDECIVSPQICGPGFCYNTAESYSCICNEGYRLDDEGNTCIDIDECADSPDLCSNGRCKNTPGSFLCACHLGFTPDEEGTSCIDMNECEVPRMCPENSLCVNTLGSYNCRLCDSGYRLGLSGQCEDVDECQDGRVCPSGLCYNTLGSFMCSPCPEGFQGRDGQCVVILVSSGFLFRTLPRIPFLTSLFLINASLTLTLTEASETCNVDECQELTGLCDGVGQCVNNMGSYYCNCPPGYRQVNGTSCQDVDECVEEAHLQLHDGKCVNTEGSFLFICEPGYMLTQDPPGCEDVDECALNRSVCRGHGVCQNTVGSFMCQCDPGYQDSDGQGCVDLNECDLLSDVCGEAVCENVPGSFLCVCPDEGLEFNRMTAKCLPTPKASSVERKECYYNLNDENLCDNVLTSSVTIEECCCTLGAGWGDNCEVFPCPVQGTGKITACDALFYNVLTLCFRRDASIFYVHSLATLLETSALCFYSLTAIVSTEKTGHTEQSVYQSVCWEFLTETKVCSHPLSNQMTTYTECCCLYGEAWGMDCALCPQRNTEEYNSMCNLRGSVSSRRPYGRDALVASPVHEYEVREYEQRRVDPNPAFYEEYDSPNTGQYDSFEGLRAEECGVLNGCENGRCVRVQEGYTCDCFDGYTLDMSRMACVDVNECSELNKRMSLCKNGKCINTPGSYRCQCLPGFTQSDRPNYCVPSQESAPSSARTATE
uniref:Latent-transforming growth factor beta-binding protein 4 n=1 Tax=Astyanax mexicanus TaxID=7994 RepID=A0A8B9JHN2_ASTMX